MDFHDKAEFSKNLSEVLLQLDDWRKLVILHHVVRGRSFDDIAKIGALKLSTEEVCKEMEQAVREIHALLLERYDAEDLAELAAEWDSPREDIL